MKTAKTTTKTRLSKPARIAIIATALLLLAALVFGIVWTNLDHSFRYDRIDLKPFFQDGKLPSFSEITTLPLKIETAKTPTDIQNQIATNISALLKDTGNRYLKTESDITLGTPDSFRDTLYLYYSIGQVTGEGENEKITPLLSNLAYANDAAASLVMLGTGDVNELLETFLAENPKLGRGDPYKAGTRVIRLTDDEDISGDAYRDYTRVLDIEVTYKVEDDDEASKTYLTLNDFYYQPNDMDPALNHYYRGESVILKETPADNTAAKVDSTVKKIDPKLIAAITEAARGLTKIGDSATNEGVTDVRYGIDTTTATYLVTYKVTLKSAFLAEQLEATIDLDNDDTFKGMTFSYKDENGTTKKIEDGKLAIAVTVERMASPSKDLVEGLVDGDEAFTAPTLTKNEGETDEAFALRTDIAYANAYIAYIKADEIRKAEEAAKEKEEAYIETLRTELWAALVERYCDLMVIPEGFEEYDRFLNETMAYHRATYASGGHSTSYQSVEEYILLSVYAEEFTDEEKTAVKSMSAEAQAKKVTELVGKDVREAIFEKVLIFALGQHYGLEVTGGEIGDYKDELYDQNLAYYEAYLKQIYSSSMSAGEIKVMAKDYAKSQIAGYTKTFYRENVMLREVKASIIPDADYKGEVTFVLAEGAES